MDWLILIKAAIMGIVEGLTEFLPISSTGHLILVAQWIHFNHTTAEVFEVVIQLGAILAVCWEYRLRLLFTLRHIFDHHDTKRLMTNILVAALPASVFGSVLIGSIKAYLFNPLTVAIALLIGGLIIIWAERREHSVHVGRIEEMTVLDALKVGCIQIFSLVPGISRSGSTIIGGLLCGLSRQVATEFSFFLAIPIMFAAAFYDGLRCRALFELIDIPIFFVGLFFAFISAFIAVRGLLKFISQHTFLVFAWYRIIFGLAMLGLWFNA